MFRIGWNILRRYVSFLVSCQYQWAISDSILQIWRVNMQYKIVPLISLILDAIVGKLKKYLVKPKLDENKTDCTLKNDFIILWIFFFKRLPKGLDFFSRKVHTPLPKWKVVQSMSTMTKLLVFLDLWMVVLWILDYFIHSFA